MPRKIFTYIEENDFWKPDVVVVALAEDGIRLATHISSGKYWAQDDIQRKTYTDKYAEHFPDYELEWVDEPATHPCLQEALTKQKEIEAA